VAVAKFDNKRDPKLCGQNCEYITRLSKADSISFHNLNELENDIEQDDLQARRNAAIAFGEARELESANNKRIKNGGKRQDRNHNTLIISWDREESPEKVNMLVKEFLEENFKNARAIYSVHTDKQNQSHAHIWIDNKLESGKSLQIKPAVFYTLDEKWTQKYDKEYTTEYALLFKELKNETFDWKKRKAIADKAGMVFDEPKPQRYGDLLKEKVKENMRKKEFEQAGVIYDEKRIDRDKRFVTAGYSAVEASKSTITNSSAAASIAVREFDSTVQIISGKIKNKEVKNDGNAINRNGIERNGRNFTR
jgi:hypothetical protein